MNREGSLGHCPFCRTALPEPTTLYGESECLQCNAQLWHLGFASGPTFFVRRAGESICELMVSLADPRYGFTAEDLEGILKDADSLDVVELLAELESNAIGRVR